MKIETKPDGEIIIGNKPTKEKLIEKLEKEVGILNDLLDTKNLQNVALSGRLEYLTKELEKMVLSRDIIHDDNPVLSWQLGNVELSIDAADNIKPDKAKSSQKIDGIVALVMAINCYMKNKGNNTKSIYEERGIISI